MKKDLLSSMHTTDGAGRRLTWRTPFYVLLMFCACAAGACGDDDKSLAADPDPVVPADPGKPDDPDDPQKPGKPLRDDATPLFFDAATAEGLDLQTIEGEPNGYTLTLDAEEGSTCFIATTGLEKPLENPNVRLTFEYRCDEPMAQFMLGFSAENPLSNLGRIETDVDRFDDGWAPYSASLAKEVGTYGWGQTGDRLWFYLRPTTAGAPITFEIRDIYLEEIAGPIEPEDPTPANIYPLTFTPNRDAYGQVESLYGIISAINFTRNDDEYHLEFVDEPGHGEHFFACDPVTKRLALSDDEKVEVVFRYKAARSFVLTFGLYPFTDPAVEWPDTWTTAENIPSSSNAGVDEEGWATYRHDLTEKINKYKWGANPGAGEPYQMRFRFRVPDGTEKAHPEKEGLTEMDLKNVYLEVSPKQTAPEPDKDPAPDYLGDYTLVWGDAGNTNKDFE